MQARAATPCAPAASRATLVVGLLLGAVVAAVYANTWGIDFQIDDTHIVEANPHIRRLSTIPHFFVDPDTSSTTPEHRVLRPLLLTTFAVNHAVSGKDAWSYHLVNLALHWLATLLVYRIVRDDLRLDAAGPPVAVVAASLMAAHPLATSAVNQVSARAAVLATVLCLATLDASVRDRRAAAVALLAATLLVDGVGAALPLLLFAYWGLPRTGGGARPPWTFGVALAVVAVGGLAYRALLMPGWLIAAIHAPRAMPLEHPTTRWPAYLYYLRLFVCPHALVADRLAHPAVGSPGDPQAWAALAVPLALGILAWRIRRRWPALTLAAVWYAIMLVAQSRVLPLAEPPSEPRGYLVMPALVTALALGLWAGARAAAARLAVAPVWPMAVAGTFLVTALGATAIGRNQTWADEYALWLDATRKAPENPRVWSTAGEVALARGWFGEARELLAHSRRLEACHAEALIALSVLERQGGDLDASLRWAEEAMRCRPGLARSHHQYGVVLERIGRLEDALRAYRRTTALDPQHTDAWVGQARLLEQRGDWVGAAAAYDAALAIDAERVEAAMAAGVIYHHRLADFRHALARYDQVLRAAPAHYGAHYQRAVALLGAGEEAAAVKAWRAFVPLAEAAGDRRTLDNAPEILRHGVATREHGRPASAGK
jgi:tetratricopeptide (TPR) repeat protein